MVVEFEVDMGYLDEYGELDCVVLHDENGEMEDVMFELERTCHNLDHRGDHGFTCSRCEYDTETYGDSLCDPSYFKWCPMCGAKVIY